MTCLNSTTWHTKLRNRSGGPSTKLSSRHAGPADLGGYVATVQEAIVDDDLLEEASVALCETPGYPVFGSRAWYFEEHEIDWQDHADSYADNWWLLHGNSDIYTSDGLRNDMLANDYTPEQVDEAMSKL